MAPFIREGVSLIFSDICKWNDSHGKHILVDAMPTQLGIAHQGCIPVSIALSVALPIYLSKCFAALTAVLSFYLSFIRNWTCNARIFLSLHHTCLQTKIYVFLNSEM